MAFFELTSLTLSLLSEPAFLLIKALCQIRQLRIQTFDFLILPLLLLGQDLKVELDVRSVVGLETAHVDLVLQLHQTVLVRVLQLENLRDDRMDD